MDKVWMDGKFVGWDKCLIHGMSFSLHYGVAAFEGIRFYNTKKGIAAFRLKDHISRLFTSAKVLGMKLRYSEKQLVDAAKKTILANPLKKGYLRPIAYYDNTDLFVHAQNENAKLMMAVLPWGEYHKPNLKVKTSSFIRLHPKSVPTEAKISGYYVNSILAISEARKLGYDEALLLDYNGNVAEGGSENFFIVKNNVLITPPLGNILPGIRRDSIITIAKDNEIKVEERFFKLDQAKSADEAFFTGTGAEISTISQIDGEKIGDGKAGNMAKKLQSIFSGIVSGENKKYQDWLEYV